MVTTTFLILLAMGYPEYSSNKSKRTYSDHAKIALLVVMAYTGKSFAEFSRMLPSLVTVLDAAGISDIPEESTLRKFRGRLGRVMMDTVLAHQSAMIVGNSETIAGVDATGMPTTHASRYYITRLKHFGTERTIVRGYTKLTLAVCVHTKAILAADTTGSRVADVRRFGPTLNKLAAAGSRVMYVAADKGYDAEYVHRMVMNGLGAEAVIPVRTNPPKKGSVCRTVGVNRSRMKRELTGGSHLKSIYNMRSISETVNSMLKRVLGDVLRGRNEETRHAETMFKCMAHNFRVGMELSSSGMLV